MTTEINLNKDIELLLAQRRLSGAFALLDNAVASLDGNVWDIKSEIARLRESYDYMSRYALEGMPDPGRGEVYEELADGIRRLADGLNRQSRIADAPTLYFNTLRYEQTQNGVSINSLAAEYCHVNDRLSFAVLAENVAQAQRDLTFRAEAIEKRLFNLIWITYPLSVDDQETISSLLTDQALPEHFKSLVIGGVTMGLLEYYDERRMRLLMDAYTLQSPELSVRALCGLLMAMWVYRSRPMSRKLRARFDSLTEQPIWDSDVKMMLLQFVRSRETERISRKLNDEVIPEMMKLRPEIEKLKNRPLDVESIEENPEWAEILEKSGVADKMKELQEIQEDGGDVMMGTFSKLKTFSFFNDISNWFLPFHTSHSLLTQSLDQTTRMLCELIVNAPMFCNSDKYSVVLSMEQIPESQRSMMASQFQAHSDQMAQLNLSELNGQQKGRENVANKYVQDLYRFFKLFRRKGEFKDPFSTSLNLANHPLLAGVFDDADTLRLVGEFCFKRKFFEDALTIFDRLSLKMPPSAELFQKMGYCCQALGRTRDALTYYSQSELFNADSRWTMRRLAACHKALGEWKEALPYYKKLAEFNPDDVTIAINTGYCHIETGEYDEALKCFFKVEFLSGESERSTRPIAWCSLLSGDYVRARKYIDILLAGKPAAADYLNAGHLDMLTGRYSDAAARYADSIVARGGDVKSFLRDLDADRHLFASATDIDEMLMGIVVDKAIAQANS